MSDITVIYDISIGAWNIDGYKNKIDDQDFLDEIRKHDIFFATETHSNDGSLQVDGFKTVNVCFQKKSGKRGKTPYGISVLIKNAISKYVTVVRVTAKHFIWVKIDKSLTGYANNVFCCGLYIPPAGSIYYKRHPDTNIFDLLNTDISHFGSIGDVLLTGDFNAHTGVSPDTLSQSELIDHANILTDHDFLDTHPRCSMEEKVCTFGNSLLDLCFAHNMCILNGRTLGDSCGNYTFFGYESNSVIDYTVVDKNILSKVICFKVHNFTGITNHCKIETVLSCSPKCLEKNRSVKENLDFVKYSWDQNMSPEKLNTMLMSTEFQRLKNHIISKEYGYNAQGTNNLSTDVEDLTKILHESCCTKTRVGRKNKFKSKRKPWFTPDLESLRKRARRSANFLGRNPNSHRARDDYNLARRRYNRLLKSTKKAHRKFELDKLLNSSDRQEMWALLSKLKPKKSSTPIDMSELHSHFEELLNTPQKQITPERQNFLCTQLSNFLNNSEPVDETISPGTYHVSLIEKIGKTLKNGKSSFIDGSINEVIKNSLGEMAEVFQKLFNHIEISAEFPTAWKSSFLVPLHKKGSPGDPNNYRGLAVGNNVGKFYTKILNEKLKKFCSNKNILSQQQFGFREDFRTSDAIFVLRSVISWYKNKGNKPVYSCFVDFSKAFDSVDRTALLYKLGTVGIQGNLLKLINNMYSESTFRLKCNGEFSSAIPCKIGVKQGCNLSPLLFNLFINDIHNIFDVSANPVNIDGNKFNTLSFADDLVLLSESQCGLQDCLSKLEKYCSDWGLKVNLTKTNVVVFNRAFTNRIKNLNFTFEGKPVQPLKSYCYLGIDISSTGSFATAMDSLYKKSLRALYSIYSTINVYSDGKSLSLFLKLFDSLVKPVLLYGCEIWGPAALKVNNPIDKLVNKFYRTLLGVPNQSSTIGIQVELGRFPISLNIKHTMLKYWTRLATLPKSRLVSHCYWSLHNINNLKDTWFTAIKQIIESSGEHNLNFLWNSQALLDGVEPKVISKCQSQILHDAKMRFLSEAVNDMDKQVKLQYFKEAKSEFTVSKYLGEIGVRSSRSLIAKLRLGVLDLEVEKGRRFKIDHSGRKVQIPRAERYCKLCQTSEIEDEVHFLFSCPTLAQTRQEYLEPLTARCPELATASHQDKLMYLYFNEDLVTEELFLASTLLSKLKTARNNLLTQ